MTCVVTLNSRSIVVLSIVGILLSNACATANLIEIDDPEFGPGSITRETETGLDWLDLNLSKDRSFADVLSQFGIGGDFEGFRYASRAELETLFLDSAGLLAECGFSFGENPCRHFEVYYSFGEMVGLDAGSTRSRFSAGGLFTYEDGQVGFAEIGGFLSDFCWEQECGYVGFKPGLPLRWEDAGFGSWLVRPASVEVPPDAKMLQAGDADQNLDFDQLDLVQVQTAAKYLTGQTATWGEGDWNGAPGGSPRQPPVGDSLFNQFDIVAALAPSHYLTGPYSAIQPNGERGDGQTSVVYNAGTGEIAVDASAGTELTSVNIDSAAGIFVSQNNCSLGAAFGGIIACQNLGGSFDNIDPHNIFKATFGGSFGSLSFGNLAQPGLDEDFVLNDLTVLGSVAGGGALGAVDLIHVPEPATIVFLCVGLLSVLAGRGGVSFVG